MENDFFHYKKEFDANFGQNKDFSEIRSVKILKS